jgi:hypothetical protein
VVGLMMMPGMILFLPVFEADKSDLEGEFLLIGTAACSGWWKAAYCLVYLVFNAVPVTAIWSMVLIVNRDEDQGDQRYLYILYFYLSFCGSSAITSVCEIKFIKSYSRRMVSLYQRRLHEVRGAYSRLNGQISGMETDVSNPISVASFNVSV